MVLSSSGTDHRNRRLRETTARSPCNQRRALSLHQAADAQQGVVDHALVEVAKAQRNGATINVREVAETILRQDPGVARSIAELTDVLARRAVEAGVSVEFDASEPSGREAVVST